MEFEAWVPNATGNLSFGAIGGPLTKRVHVRQHLRVAGKRWLVVAQTRTNPDRLLPDFLFPTLGIEGLPTGSRPRKTTYAMLARSAPIGQDSEGALEGILCGLVRPRRKLRRLFKRADTPAERAFKELGITGKNFASAAEAERKSLPFSLPRYSDWARLLYATTAASEFTCYFKLHRSGKVFLSLIKYPTVDSQKKVGLASQLYYFLKDTSHSHYHHDASSDAIIEITEVAADPDWRHKTIRNLYREVLDLRRSGEDDLLANALGVIAYASTFDSEFHDSDVSIDGRPKIDIDPLPVYSEGIITSIGLKREKSQRTNDRRHLDIQFFIGAIIASLAALFGLYPEFSAGSISQKVGRRALDIMSYSPTFFFVALALVGVIYFANNRHSSGRFRRGLYEPLYRLFAWLPQWAFITIPAAVTALAGISFVLMVAYAVAKTPPSHGEDVAKPTIETVRCRQEGYPNRSSESGQKPSAWTCSAILGSK